MPKKTTKELREWYQKFARELYEKVQLDVTRKEDLGRVRICRSDDWSVDNIIPEMQVTYAYIPHDGTGYAVPEPPVGDFQKYAKWMTENLDPNVTDAQIQELYDQSCAGSLMAYKPGGSLGNIQMVLTDDEGNIKISVPASDYFTEEAENIPEDQRPFDLEGFTEPDPADFGLPELPEPPENMDPGWLSRLGHFLGFHTEYTDLLIYREALDDYNTIMDKWMTNPDREENFGKEAFDRAVEQAVLDRQAHEERVRAFLANPYCRHLAIYKSNEGKLMEYPGKEFERQMKHRADEQEFLQNRHMVTPLGKLAEELPKIEDQLAYAGITEQALFNLVGHDPHPELLPNRDALTGFKPEKYELPQDPNLNYVSVGQERAIKEKWRELAAVAGFAATADYDILGSELRPGFNREETAALRYSMVLPNLFTEFRSGVQYELPYVEPARQLARKALYAYNDGEPQQLGQILARSLRQNLRGAAPLNKIVHANTWGNLYLVSKLVETLDRHPTVRAASGLTPDELTEARGVAEQYRVLTKGTAARKDLLEHALGKKTLSPEALEQAGKDALLASYVIYEMGAAFREQSQIIENSPRYKKLVEEMEYNSEHYHVLKQADEAKKQGMEVAGNLYKMAEEMEKQVAIARGRIILENLNYPPFHLNRKLLDENWVDAARERLAGQVGLTAVLSSPKGIVETFHSGFELAKITKELMTDSKPGQLEKAPEIRKNGIQNAQPQPREVGIAH